MAGLLKGVKVIESAMLMTGDFAGQLLADEGAEVIKMESPFKGDYLRDFTGQFKPHEKGNSPAHVTVNRNKKSVTVNLRTPEGKDIFWRMFEDCDVFVDGNTPGAMAKLGVGYEDQKRVKPGIIYGHVTGLGARGPYADIPTHGMSMNALAGAEPCEVDERGFAVRRDGGGLSGAASGVAVGPLYLALGVAAALYRREKTGEGAYIDVGCSDAIVAQCWQGVVNALNAEKIEPERGGGAGKDAPKYNFYETKDGKFLLVALIERHFWESFCKSIDRPDLLEEGVGYETMTHVVDWGPPSLRAELAKIFRGRTLSEWMEVAREADCVISPANSVLDLPTDEHLKYREAVILHRHPTAGEAWVSGNPIKVPGEHYTVYRHAPALGEHTEEYLRSFGYDEGQLKAWKEQGVI